MLFFCLYESGFSGLLVVCLLILSRLTAFTQLLHLSNFYFTWLMALNQGTHVRKSWISHQLSRVAHVTLTGFHLSGPIAWPHFCHLWACRPSLCKQSPLHTSGTPQHLSTPANQCSQGSASPYACCRRRKTSRRYKFMLLLSMSWQKQRKEGWVCPGPIPGNHPSRRSSWFRISAPTVRAGLSYS